jgi:hypothetical protein
LVSDGRPARRYSFRQRERGVSEHAGAVRHRVIDVDQGHAALGIEREDGVVRGVLREEIEPRDDERLIDSDGTDGWVE